MLLIALASAIGLTEIFDALLSSVLLVSELFAASITLDKFSADVATDFVYSDPSMDELSLQNELSREDSRVFLYFRIFPRYLSSRTALLRFLSETYMIVFVKDEMLREIWFYLSRPLSLKLPVWNCGDSLLSNG